MTYDVEVGLVVLHHAVGEIDLFGQAHGIHLAAHPADLARILTPVGVRIGEVNSIRT